MLGWVVWFGLLFMGGAAACTDEDLVDGIFTQEQ